VTAPGAAREPLDALVAALQEQEHILRIRERPDVYNIDRVRADAFRDAAAALLALRAERDAQIAGRERDFLAGETERARLAGCCDVLQAERDDALMECDELVGIRNDLCATLAERNGELAAALRRAEEGERDSARLDKLERVLRPPASVIHRSGDPDNPGFLVGGRWMPETPTLRAALDAYVEPARTEGGRDE